MAKINSSLSKVNSENILIIIIIIVTIIIIVCLLNKKQEFFTNIGNCPFKITDDNYNKQLGVILTNCKIGNSCQLNGKAKGETYICYNSQIKTPDGKMINNAYWSKKGKIL